MTDLDSAHEAIEVALNPPPLARINIVRRLVRRGLLRLGSAHARHQQRIDRQLLALIGSLDARLDSAVGSLDARLASLDARLETTDVCVARLEQAAEDLSTHSLTVAEHARGLSTQVGELQTRLGPIESFAAQVQVAPEPEALGFERFEVNGAGTVMGYREAASPVSPEDDYVAFEDVFRLSEDVIRERQRPYLSIIGGREPVLDAGCGRGEFLELLRDAGLQARGVDLDPGMIARAQAKGLDVKHGDLLAHLGRVRDGSLGVVFAAQVVEHLAYPALLQFLRLACRKLQPGGLLIAETVNPHAPGSLKSFWTDPTHHHPLFPEVLLTLSRGVGFASAYVFHPGGTSDFDADRRLLGDYAIVAETAGREEPDQPTTETDAADGTER